MSNTENVEPVDNLEQAMNHIADLMDHSISTKISGETPADKQVLIRTTDDDRERWKAAAQIRGMSLAEFLRDTINQKVVEILECIHPMDMRKSYPWSEFCLRCNKRLR